MHYDLKKSKTQPDSSSSKEKSSSSESNLIKIIENHNICCEYKINIKNYYRNVPYCHYRKKLII